MLVLIEIGEYSDAPLRPYLVVEKGLSGEELLKLFVLDRYFEPGEQVIIDHNKDLGMVFRSSQQYLKVKQIPISSMGITEKIRKLEKRVEELDQLCRCCRQEEQAYYGQHR
jgi:hypothetical protein